MRTVKYPDDTEKSATTDMTNASLLGKYGKEKERVRYVRTYVIFAFFTVEEKIGLIEQATSVLKYSMRLHVNACMYLCRHEWSMLVYMYTYVFMTHMRE